MFVEKYSKHPHVRTYIQFDVSQKRFFYFGVVIGNLAGAPKGNFREKICSEDDLRSRIFGALVVKFLACLPLLGFSNIYKVFRG